MGRDGMDRNEAPEARGYEWRMVLVTSLAIAFLAFDRLASGYLGPYLLKGLALSKTELGSIYSIQAVAVAVAGFFIGRLSDRTGNRRRLLAVLLVLSASCACAALLVHSYAALMIVRLASGLALGAVSPISQSMVTNQSTPVRLGRNIGVQTLFMFVVSQVLGPILLPRIAERWGWQAGFAFTALPFVILAGAVLLLLRDNRGQPDIGIDNGAQVLAAPLPAKARRVILLCLGIAACFMIWLVILSTFLSVYLVEHHGLTPTEAGSMLGTLGIAGGIGGFLLPLLSDRLGRKHILLFGLALASIAPLAALFWQGSLWGLQAFFAVGWLAVGILPLYAVVIPGSTVPPNRAAAIIALVIGTGEMVGGVGGPVVAGWLADRYGIVAPFWLALGAVGGAAILAALLPRDVG